MKIHLFGQLYGCIGIPNHTRDLFREIIKQAPDDTTLYPIVPGASTDRYDIDDLIESHTSKNVVTGKLSGFVFVFWDPSVYAKVLSLCDRPSTIAVGYLIFEWNKLQKDYLQAALLMNYLAVPSQWHKQVLLDHGVDENKIIILEAGVNPAYLKDYDVERKHKYIFVGKYEKRKCIEELISSFIRVVPQEQASLTLLCTDPHDPHFDVVKALHLDGRTNIDICAKPRTPEEMAKLYAAHQYILVPSRSGGIELPLIEGMACGCIPLVTKASGMQYYLPPGYTWFIPVKEMVPMYDDRWFKPTINWGTWAEPDWETFDKYLANTMASPIDPHMSIALKLRAQTLYNYPEIVKSLRKWFELVEKARCKTC